MDAYQRAFACAEQVAGRDYLLATYYLEMEPGGDALRKAASLAIGQSLGTWTDVPGLTDEMRASYLGRVAAVFDVPPVELRFNLPQDKRRLIVQIAFPEINFGDAFPMMLTALLGNDVSTSAQTKLLDLHFSPALAASFGGPRFGIAGLRERLGVPDRPLILNIIKPNTGFTPQAGAQFFAEAARGGADIIKDDELLGSPAFNRAWERAHAYGAAARQVYEETGHRALVCINITDRPDRILENGRRAVAAGADMVMVNAVSSGLGMVQAVASDPAISVPVLTHYAGAAALTEGVSLGIASPLLLGKLMRLCGSDATSFNSPYSVYPLLRENYVRTAQLLTLPLYDIKPSLPTPGGGIHPAAAVQIIQDLGSDVLFAVGGAIQGHPDGATAGAKAMRQAVDAAMAGVPLAEAARQFAELAKAVERWGAAVH